MLQRFLVLADHVYGVRFLAQPPGEHFGGIRLILDRQNSRAGIELPHGRL